MATPTKEAIQRLVGLGYPESVAKRIAGGSLLAAALAPEDAEAATAYKLFRQANDKLYPLFVNRNQEVPVGEWLKAEAGELTDQGKVKSSLGPLAYRPGWHAGDLPMATHIGGKSGPVKAPNYRPSDQVWAEVEFPEDVDWQAIADANATRNKAGEIIPRTAQITDQVPYGGFYRYKTNPNMTGEWLIGGDMRVNRVLSDEEVRAINESAGVADLPRLQSIKDKTMLAAPAVGAGLLGASVLGSPDASANSVLPYNSREDLIASIEGRLRPLPEPEPTIAPTENDTIGQIVNTVANLFGGGYYDYRAAENLMYGADFLPWFGSGISLQQGADAYRQGKVGEGRLLTGLGLLEFIPVAGKIASNAVKARMAGRAANRSLDDFASRMSEAEIATRAPQTQEELMRALGWQ